VASVIKDVDIFVFDFHLDLRPLLSPARLTKDFEFLGDPAKYHAQQSAAKPFTAGALTLHPLGVRSRKRNRFWTRYNPGFNPGATPDWDIQVPFSVRPGTTLGFDAAPGAAKVRSSILASAIGWSTQLELAIQGNFNLDDLQALTQRLLDRDQRPFTFGKVPSNLPGILKYFGDLWQNAVFRDPKVSPRDTNPIQRHIVISIGGYNGTAKSYRRKVGSTSAMTGAEGAQLHGILLGRQFTVQELAGAEFTYVPFGDSNNFAISYFGHGSLIFMQDEALDSKNRRESMRCMARNLSHFSQLAVSIPIVLRRLASESAPAPQNLRQSLKNCLKSLGDNYTNEFCSAWFKTNSLLQQL
jgi:hypothetical protein